MARYDKQRLLSALATMPPPSGKSLPTPIIYGFTSSPAYKGFQLAELRHVTGRNIRVDRPNVSLMTSQFASQKVMTFTPENAAGGQKNFTGMVNDELLGGDDYPVLTGVLSILIGAVSAGAGIAFTVVTTALATQKTVQRILVREGDELWLTELVGKAREGNDTKVYHASYFWIVDPYRKVGGRDGYAVIVHEDRDELVLQYT